MSKDAFNTGLALLIGFLSGVLLFTTCNPRYKYGDCLLNQGDYTNGQKIANMEEFCKKKAGLE